MDFCNLKNFMDSLTDWVIPGNSATVYKDGKKVFEYSSGFSDIKNKTPKTADDFLYIYSCSKIATVTAALQLYEQGKFLMTDPLYEYIPEFKEMYLSNGERAKNAITMKHLFTMTAGLTYNTETAGFDKARKLTGRKMDTVIVARCIAGDTLQFEPGESWSYSLCHDVLAAAVEVISGKRFSEYMKENIFLPLGMDKTCYHADKDKISCQYIYDTGGARDVVTLQGSTSSNGVVKDAGKDNSLVFGDEYDSGGAGIVTTVNDYAIFAAALAGKGVGLNGSRILGSGTVELLKTNQLSSAQLKGYNWHRLAGYGYGLGVRTMIDRAAASSNGSIGEFGWGGAAGANVIVDTDLNFAVVYAHHMLNPQEEYYQPRLRNVVYSCF